jgi:hypothetical protein
MAQALYPGLENRARHARAVILPNAFATGIVSVSGGKRSGAKKAEYPRVASSNRRFSK